MELNLIKCASGESTFNTGVSDCPYIPGYIVGAILATSKISLAPANFLTAEALYTFLETAAQAPRASRIYPIAALKGLEADNTEAPTEFTFGYGDQETIREGKINWSYRYQDGGLCLHNNLRKLNGTKVYAFFIDNNGVVIGTRNGENMDAIPLTKFFAPPFGVSNGSEPSKFLVNLSFDPKYINENIAFLDPDGEVDFMELKGLLNVKLTSKLVAGDAVTTAKVSCGGTDLYDLYAYELAEITAWKAKGANGAAIVISAVVKDDVQKAWVISTAADFVAGDIIELAAPSVLSEAPISVSGYEGLPGTVTV